jgi:hypothetical protein
MFRILLKKMRRHKVMSGKQNGFNGSVYFFKKHGAC